jgi:hypothetical protein
VTAYENKKDDFWMMLEEEKEKIKREKDHLLIEKTPVKQVVRRTLHSVPCLAQEENEVVEVQVMKLVEAIQQLQARVMELELQVVPRTLLEVHDQREEATKRTIGRIRALALECKQLRNKSVQNYKCLMKDPELRKLEVKLQEVQQQALTIQVQMKSLTVSERIKISQEHTWPNNRLLPSIAESWRSHRGYN